MSGIDAMLEAGEFLRVVRNTLSRFMPHVPAGESRVLDFGCGWGRITRLLSKDWPATTIFSCDPSADAIDACRKSGVIGTFAVSDPANRSLPYAEAFDVVTAFSVFTHFSESLHRTTLETLARSIRSGGMLILTVRPRYSLRTRSGWPRSPELSATELADMLARYDRGEYVFEPLYLDKEGSDWGNSWIPCTFIEAEWTRWFEPVAYSLLPAYRQQFVVSLKKR
jgi:SAM-dependent methyltransferase